ncbi:MAG: lipoate--protein ligase [Planctomycetota bacterium]
MQFLDNRGGHDPYLNLALEEFCVRNLPAAGKYVLFYVNEPSIIIGKNQNTIEEINADYVAAHGVHVVRRISGGGAVYHDHGNLNFSFIEPYRSGSVLKFAEFTAPVVRVLRELGVPAELTGRNDILADGRKISGNAQFFTAHKMFSHGTLLFASQLDNVSEALRVRAGKIESKGLKSVRSRVANISEFLSRPMELEEFRERLLAGLFAAVGGVTAHELSAADWSAVEELAASKYRQWSWNYGASPACNVQRSQRYAIGEIDARLDVREGLIQSVRFFGDFLGERDVAELEARLGGVRYEAAAIDAALAAVAVKDYFGGLTAGELRALLW